MFLKIYKLILVIWIHVPIMNKSLRIRTLQWKYKNWSVSKGESGWKNENIEEERKNKIIINNK